MNEQSITIRASSGTEWMTEATCRKTDPNLFFVSDAVGIAAAKAICNDCVVRSVCLEYALDNRIDDGIWGGTTEEERRQTFRQRRRQTRRPA